MDEPHTFRRRWPRYLLLGLLALLLIPVLALVGFEFISSDWTSQSQLDTSTGRIRHADTRFGEETFGEPTETFISRQLGGQSIDPEPDWRPMTTHRGGGFVGSHGHSGVDRVWNRYSEVESLWDDGGFTEQARTACARRMLEIIKLNDLSACHDYVDALQKHVDALEAVPEAQRRTTVEDLEALDD